MRKETERESENCMRVCASYFLKEKARLDGTVVLTVDERFAGLQLQLNLTGEDASGERLGEGGGQRPKQVTSLGNNTRRRDGALRPMMCF